QVEQDGVDAAGGEALQPGRQEPGPLDLEAGLLQDAGELVGLSGTVLDDQDAGHGLHLERGRQAAAHARGRRFVRAVGTRPLPSHNPRPALCSRAPPATLTGPAGRPASRNATAAVTPARPLLAIPGRPL